jgi:hypothetical protein
MLNRMTKEEGEKAGIEAGRERLYFRADSDGNLAPAAATEWFHHTSVGLGNGSGSDADQDYVGVATAWTWPDAFENVTVSHLRDAQTAVAAGRWRENPQAKDWAGVAIAKVLNLDMTKKADKAKVIAMLRTWIENGMFVVVEGEDEKRMTRKFIEVGTPAND